MGLLTDLHLVFLKHQFFIEFGAHQLVQIGFQEAPGTFCFYRPTAGLIGLFDHSWFLSGCCIKLRSPHWLIERKMYLQDEDYMKTTLKLENWYWYSLNVKCPPQCLKSLLPRWGCYSGGCNTFRDGTTAIEGQGPGLGSRTPSLLPGGSWCEEALLHTLVNMNLLLKQWAKTIFFHYTVSASSLGNSATKCTK